VVPLLLAASGTALATGLGAVPVFLLGRRAERLQPALWGLAAGVMVVAAVVGLLLPAIDEGSDADVLLGGSLGIAFLVVSRQLLEAPRSRVRGLRSEGLRTSVLVFAVLLVHSLPEGFAIGSAWASDTAGLGAFVVLAIALQNVPEGTSVAIPMAEAGFRPRTQFWAAVATSVPQPIGAAVAYLLVEEIDGLLGISFAFAAGAMLSLVALELLPRIWRRDSRQLGGLGFAVGAAIMLAADLALAPG
jgi:ZIP family zinc transporter